MHYLAYAVTEKGTEKEICDLMEPHRETFNEEDDGCSGFWDWYQIGGRWTGYLSDYDPTKDPANHEPCELCAGTGTRNDVHTNYQNRPCNGCSRDDTSVGIRIKWPTQFVQHNGDKVTITDGLLRDLKLPHTYISKDLVLEQNYWTGVDFKPSEDYDNRVKESLRKNIGSNLAVIDYHC
jgi:hypothetical protein